MQSPSSGQKGVKTEISAVVNINVTEFWGTMPCTSVNRY
jgi:hypothetical protein